MATAHLESTDARSGAALLRAFSERPNRALSPTGNRRDEPGAARRARGRRASLAAIRSTRERDGADAAGSAGGRAGVDCGSTLSGLLNNVAGEKSMDRTRSSLLAGMSIISSVRECHDLTGEPQSSLSAHDAQPLGDRILNLHH